jgi:hypothetical protein
MDEVPGGDTPESLQRNAIHQRLCSTQSPRDDFQHTANDITPDAINPCNHMTGASIHQKPLMHRSSHRETNHIHF